MTGPSGTQTCNASGTYVLIDLTAGTVGGDDCAALDALGAADPPYTVRVHLRTQALTYRTTIRVAPGELHA